MELCKTPIMDPFKKLEYGGLAFLKFLAFKKLEYGGLAFLK